jgi:hypothetical protein
MSSVTTTLFKSTLPTKHIHTYALLFFKTPKQTIGAVGVRETEFEIENENREMSKLEKIDEAIAELQAYKSNNSEQSEMEIELEIEAEEIEAETI